LNKITDMKAFEAKGCHLFAAELGGTAANGENTEGQFGHGKTSSCCICNYFTTFQGGL